MALSVGDLLGNKYKILKHLGRGSRGDVYLAEDRLLARRVAVKNLRLGSVHEQADVERFLAEARTIARIRDQNVVAIYDAIEEKDERNYYLIMEYADGGTVADLLQREGRLPVLRALEMGLAAVRALQVVHAQDILHGDIKPSNILLVRSPDGLKTKLADFGLARMIAGAEAGQATYSGSILYSSPEQLHGEAVDHRADLYALGAVLYEMLTGQSPFPYTGEPADMGQVIQGHLKEAPVPPSQLNPDVSPMVDEVILKALRKVPDERYPDAWTMGQALHQAMEVHRAWQERVETVYAQGLEHERREEWEEVIACYEAVLAEQPGHPEAQTRLEQARESLHWERLYKQGLGTYERGEWVEVEEVLSQVVAHDEGYAGGDAAAKLEEARKQRELAKLYEEARGHEADENWSDTVALYLKILTLQSNYKDVPARLAYAAKQQKQQALYNQAQEHLAAEAWAEAVKTLQELEHLEAGYKDSTVLLVEARRQKRLHELYTQAIQALNVGEWASAIEAFNQVLQLEPEYKDAAVKRAIAERQARLVDLYEQAQAQMEAEEWADAATTLQEIQEMSPSYQDVDRLLEEALQKRRIADLHQEGMRLYGQGEWEQAIQRLEEVQEVHPGYRDVEQTLKEAQGVQRVHALYAQARQFEDEEKWVEAIGVYSEILRLDRNHRDAKVGLARVSAVALGREQGEGQPHDAERRERNIAIGGALLVIAALSCMLFVPLSRIAGAFGPTPTSPLVVISNWTPSPTTPVTPTSPTPSSTPTPTRPSTPTPTPTATPPPTGTPTSTFTPTGTPSPTPTCVPQAELVRHLTIRDGTYLSPGVSFIKRWLLRNAGPCPWPEGSRLVFVSGAQMGGLSEQEIDELPAFTETVTVSASLVAPTTADDYEGKWQIQDDNDDPIGETFRVFIRVGSTPTAPPVYSPPVLDPVSIIGTNVIFKWSWPGTLKEDEWFAVRVGKDESPHSVTWIKEYEYTYSLPPDPAGDYSWEIKICRGAPAIGICEQLAVSERGVFLFGGPPVCNPRTDPDCP